MNVYSMGDEDLQRNANIVKDLMLSYLERNGVLEKGQAEKIGEQTIIVLYKRGFLGRWLDKAVGKDSPEMTFLVAEIK